MEDLIYRICDWADEKGITANSDTSHQLDKTFEEMHELMKAMRENNIEEINDAIGDIAVTLIVGYYLQVKDKYIVADELLFYSDAYNLVNAHYDDIRSLIVNRYFIVCNNIPTYNTIDVKYFNEIFGVLEALSEKYNTTLKDCLAMVLDVITKRQGKMVNGVFVKSDSTVGEVI